MSRPKGSKNNTVPPKIVTSSESERLEYIANLLLEILEDELQKSEAK